MVRRPKSRPVAKAKSAQTDRDEAEGESPASRPREKSAQTVPAAENIGPHASSTRPGRIEIASGEQASATAQRPQRSHRKAAPMPVDAELTKSPRGSRNAKRAEVLPGVTIPDAERGSELTPPQARSKPRGRAGAKEKQAEARAPEVMERLASPVPDDSERPPAAGLRRSRKQRDEPAKAVVARPGGCQPISRRNSGSRSTVRESPSALALLRPARTRRCSNILCGSGVRCSLAA